MFCCLVGCFVVWLDDFVWVSWFFVRSLTDSMIVIFSFSFIVYDVKQNHELFYCLIDEIPRERRSSMSDSPSTSAPSALSR